MRIALDEISAAAERISGAVEPTPLRLSEWLSTPDANVYCKLGGIGMVSFCFDFHQHDSPPSSEDLAAAWRQYI